MIDFLRANPFVTREEYMWKWTIPQIKIASVDFTHVVYLSEKQREKKKKYQNSQRIDGATMLNDLGVPIL